MAAPSPSAPGARLITPTGSELIPIIAGGPISQVATAASIAALGATGKNTVITALNTVGAGTITAAGIVGKITTRGGSQANAAFTDTTATGAQIEAALGGGASVGESWDYSYENTTNANATIQAGASGVTLSGITLVPAGATARWLVTRTAANTYTMVGFSLTYPSTLSGTFTANGASAVTVADTRITANSVVVITLATVGGTVGAIPHLATVTPGTGFTVVGTASDTSIYNYLIIN